MITGIHAIVFSSEAEKVRDFFADVLGLSSVDAGRGWRIFALPPAELAVHPADGASGHQLYLMCDDIAATLAELTGKGVEVTQQISDRGWGLVAAIRLPDGSDFPIYEPRHPSPLRLLSAAGGGGPAGGLALPQMTLTAQDVIAGARRLADDVLFPDAMRVDRLDVLPVVHLDALAAAGLYGAPAPAEVGGLGLDLSALCTVIEELASGCLATAFVWVQHFGLLMSLAVGGAPEPLRHTWLDSACQGRTRGGIALTGQIPGPPLLRARPAEGGWRLDGTAPWVTGWGLIDLVLVVARGPDDTLVTLIMDAAAQPGLEVTRQRLVAVDAAVTVRLGLDGVLIPQERLVSHVPFDPAVSLQPAGLRINGSLALGVILRCCRLLGPGPLDHELAECRQRLDAALEDGAAAMAAARAAACELAVRAAAALAVRDGAHSITVDHHAQRLAREALFLLVFGSRPGIKNALLHRLGAVAV